MNLGDHIWKHPIRTSHLLEGRDVAEVTRELDHLDPNLQICKTLSGQNNLRAVLDSPTSSSK